MSDVFKGGKSVVKIPQLCFFSGSFTKCFIDINLLFISEFEYFIDLLLTCTDESISARCR